MSDVFTSKQIITNTLGERLKQTRTELGISLAQASQATKINTQHLQYLEDGDYRHLPSSVYVKNYLKVYCAYLDLDWSRLETLYQNELFLFKKPATPARTSHLHKSALFLPKFFYAAGIGMVILILLIYLGVQINNFLEPPYLYIESPVDNLTTTDNFIEVIGKTLPEAQVSINGQESAVDAKGNFRENVSLAPGFNTLQITATTKHHRPQIINKQIIVANKDSAHSSNSE